jgi:hypothetical protein
VGVTFVEQNSWLEDWDFARDGLHINRREATRLRQLYSRVGGLGCTGKKMYSLLMRNDSNEGASDSNRKTNKQENSMLTSMATENGKDDESGNEGVRSRDK